MARANDTVIDPEVPPERGGLASGSAPLVLVAVAALLAGLVYYALCRSTGTPLGDALAALFPRSGSSAGDGAIVVDPTGGTLPSFLHALALVSLALAFAGTRRRRRVALVSLVLGLAVIGEFTLGTFDGNDLVACLLGSGAALLLARTWRRSGVAALPDRAEIGCGTGPGAKYGIGHGIGHGIGRRVELGSGALVALSFAFVTGTAPYERCGTDNDCGTWTADEGNTSGVRLAEPVYLGYEELRRSVNIGAPRPIESLGRLYVFGDRLFLNRRNDGVHVIDNSDPAAPVNASFITIPGNTELEIRGTNLYADSYIDLVTIDLGGTGYVELDRTTEVFPYDEYQNVPDDIVFVDVDPDRGVVIGHE